MTNICAEFLKTNKDLLDTDLVEFFHSVYNGLSNFHQKEVVEVLTSAGIDTEQAREHVLRFILTMHTEVLIKPIRVRTFVELLRDGGLLGFDVIDVKDFLINNANEWDVHISYMNNDYYIVPEKDI